jgi:RimJ/RimL family protein N-acetyltransferase
MTGVHVSEVVLREIVDGDLEDFFAHQQDPEADRMAAFTEDPADRKAFEANWAQIRAAEDATARTITVDGAVVGYIVSIVGDGNTSVGYSVDRAFWGRGIASRALAQFLEQVRTRPLFARATKDNVGSLRVLERCGFTVIDERSGYARGRGEVVEFVVLALRTGGAVTRVSPTAGGRG